MAREKGHGIKGTAGQVNITFARETWRNRRPQKLTTESVPSRTAGLFDMPRNASLS